MFPRRALAALFLLAASPAAAEEVARPLTYRFDVLREGSPIGWHRVTIHQRADFTEVQTVVDLAVRLGFLTLFKFHQTVREVWHDGRLVELDASTDDDGDRYQVRVRPDGDGLAVSGFAGALRAPRDAVPTTYWHEATASGSALIDTRKGRVTVPAITDMGWETIEASHRPVEAHRFRLAGIFNFDIWYDRAGVWQKTRFFVRGGEIDEVADGIDGDPGLLAALAERLRAVARRPGG